MKLKLASLGLLALAPMAAQAELVEMQDTELADVQGQGSLTIPGILFSRTVEVGVDRDYVEPTYDATYTDVLGGVKRDSTFKTRYTLTPYFDYESKGNITQNPYRTVHSSKSIDLWDINYSRTRTDRLFNPDR